jgi:hypothetical protein
MSAPATHTFNISAQQWAYLMADTAFRSTIVLGDRGSFEPEELGRLHLAGHTMIFMLDPTPLPTEAMRDLMHNLTTALDRFGIKEEYKPQSEPTER